MEVIKLNARSRDIAESTLNLYLDQCKNSTLLRSQRALVVDGKTLIYILDKRANIQHLFLDLTKMCSSVLACRATPLQVKNMQKMKNLYLFFLCLLALFNVPFLSLFTHCSFAGFSSLASLLVRHIFTSFINSIKSFALNSFPFIIFVIS